VESKETSKTAVKTVVLDRSQARWEPVDLESLIEEDHAARIIWKLCGQFDLSRFEEQAKTLAGAAGRPCWPAQLLVSIWAYGYTLGVASARGLGRMMRHEPGLRWLAADQEVNYHTLADFRVGHQKALDELFAQFLTLLETAGLVDLDRLLHDGTKVRAVAGRSSLHRHKTVEKRLQRARKVVRELDQQAASENEGMDDRHRAAQARVAREALKRAEAAWKKLKDLAAKAAPREQKDVRVSVSEPEARNMKHADGGWGPSYNVQVSTEGRSRMIVGVGLTTAANDTQELIPALERAEKMCGGMPHEVIADKGYASRANVEAASERNVELITPWKEDTSREAGACKRNGINEGFEPSAFHTQRGGKRLKCPAGKMLVVIGQKTHHGVLRNVFEAKAADCAGCEWKRQCCGKREGPRQIERVVESTAMKEYLARMKRPEVKDLYKKRCEIAEFPHLWFKGVKNLRRFRVRGLVKAEMEAKWIALAYNLTQWMRIQAEVTVAA
jgi:transposase